MKIKMVLPDNVIADFKKIFGDTEKIFGGMTKAGAEVVLQRVKASAPQKISSYAKISRVYRTPSNGRINSKVYFSGYLPFSDPKRKYFKRRGRKGGAVYTSTEGVPAAFLANLYEYGRSTAPWPTRPFLRPAFANTHAIEQAMIKAQKELSGGLLSDK